MAIDFPTSPVVDQVYSYGDRTWKWTGYGWKGISTTAVQLDQVFYFDSFEKYFDDRENRFQLQYQGTPIIVTNPFRLIVVLNGATQAMYYPEYVYQSVFTPDFCFIDADGYLVFPEPVPAGSMCTVYYGEGPTIPTVSSYYPFDAMDILVGAGN